MLKLLPERIPQLIVRLEILRIAKLQTDLLAGILVEAVEQRQLEYLRDI